LPTLVFSIFFPKSSRFTGVRWCVSFCLSCGVDLHFLDD
jgi:hypothetical protein